MGMYSCDMGALVYIANIEGFGKHTVTFLNINIVITVHAKFKISKLVITYTKLWKL